MQTPEHRESRLAKQTGMGCASTPFRFEDSEDRSVAQSRVPGFSLGIYVSKDVEVIYIPCGAFSDAHASGYMAACQLHRLNIEHGDRSRTIGSDHDVSATA